MTKVAVSMFATPDVVKAAHEWGAQLLIVHEPTYFNHMDNHSDEAFEVEKRALIESTGIIICRYPYHTEKCVKRVIAVPGDRISIYDGAIYLNGQKLDESAYWDDYIEGTLEEVTVPDKCLFVVGDNRNHSGDSRHVGFIPYCQVKGKVRAVMTPFSQARWI